MGEKLTRKILEIAVLNPSVLRYKYFMLKMKKSWNLLNQ